MQADTIMAPSGGRGKSGIAVLRISGFKSSALLRALAGIVPEPRRFSVRRLIDPHTGIVLDLAGILFMPGPSSCTGEDVGELHIHGGPAIIAAVMDAALSTGLCRMAEPGEFTRRAFEHGRMDLAMAEGLADLIDAETEGQRRAAMRLYDGDSSEVFEGWRQRLIEAMAALEAELDFPDEADIDIDLRSPARHLLSGLRGEMEQALAASARDMAIRDGYRIAILGAPNVGKSSLFNAIAGRDAAIVSAISGTTRDRIELRLDWGGFPVVLQDTAGLRVSTDPIEQEGMARSRQSANAADLRLWVIDAVNPVLVEEFETNGNRDMLVLNKCDLLEGESLALADLRLDAEISAHSGAGVDELIAALTEQVSSRLGGESPPLAARQRHRDRLAAAQQAMERALAGLDAGAASELISEDIRLAASELAALTGRISADAVLDSIFARFCLGK